MTVALLAPVSCEASEPDPEAYWDEEKLGHEFLIRQATTVNVNAATQLLTVTMVAIQDTSERLVWEPLFISNAFNLFILKCHQNNIDE